MLLLLSWIFYAWHVPQYIVLIWSNVAVIFVAAKLIDRPAESNRDLRTKKWILAAALLFNLSLLGWFKYAGFFITSINQLGNELWPGTGEKAEILSVPHLLLPIGISFYTFQAISYLIDVYRGQIQAERNFVRLACYISFSPQLIAGPIVRAGDFLYQLRRRRRFHSKAFFEGGYLILRGLFLKLVIADNIAQIVDKHWDMAGRGDDGVMAFSLLAFFACQLFCDFAAYTDMARGFAYQLGYRLPINFNAPYIATSFADFWRRWHISLSTWFRDYLYIPLGGNRSTFGTNSAVLLGVMGVSGLWHGANWTFLVWGLFLGLCLVAERLLYLTDIPKRLGTFACFAIMQLVWIFSMALFRSEDLSQAAKISQSALTFLPDLVAQVFASIQSQQLGGDGVCGWQHPGDWNMLPMQGAYSRQQFCWTCLYSNLRPS